MLRALIALLAALISLPAASQTNPAARIYDSGQLAAVRADFATRWPDYLRRDIHPRLNASERHALADLHMHVELLMPHAEPFGFAARGGTVFVSASSLLFLQDMSTAAAWLEVNGFVMQTASEYMLMLRYWSSARHGDRPARPLEALCIPADALSTPRVNILARNLFEGTIAFVLLHEIGHVLLHGQATGRPSPAQSRKQEEDADTFALDHFGRDASPLAVPFALTLMTHSQESPTDFGTEAEFRDARANRTHPLTAARLRAIARYFARPGVELGAGTQRSTYDLAEQIQRLAHILGQPDQQAFHARIGATVTRVDLAPRRPGQRYAAPCGSKPATDVPFSGYFQGKITDGSSALDVSGSLSREGARVTGRYSYGKGFTRLDGIVSGQTLDFSWEQHPYRGRGIATWQAGAITASIGNGNETRGAATITLTQQR